jgi:hypothetical protein
MTRHASSLRGFAVVLLLLSSAAGTLAQVKGGFATADPDVARAFLVATPDGDIVRDESKTIWTATPTTHRPGTPVARLVATTSRPLNPLDTLTAPPPILKSSECLVDFSDYDALDRLTYAPPVYPLYAEDTHAWAPWWFQACNGIDHAVVRPIAPFEHFHLGYEDPAIQPCAGGVVDWDIIHEDGTCEEFDPRDKPRRLTSHDYSAVIHLYLYDGYGKKTFGLNGLRVLGENAVRLCYKPAQEDDGAWETSEPGGTTSPGIWLCWDELSIGTWDLSGYAGYITEVKLSSTGMAGSITIDDVVLKVY